MVNRQNFLLLKNVNIVAMESSIVVMMNENLVTFL